MKTRKFIFHFFFLLASTTLLFIGCKKTHEYTLVNTVDDTDTQTIIASDELEVNKEFDIAVDEAIKASCISSVTSGDATTGGTGNILFTTISGAIIDTGASGTGVIKINYYGQNADHTKGRTGEIKIQHATISGTVIPWTTAAATATITFTQYEVIFLPATVNKSIWLNGTATISNLSGGLLKNIANPLLVPGDSLVDKIRSKIDFTYNDNTTLIQTWVWYFNQHRVLKLEDTTVTATIKGDTIINNTSNVTTRGTTRSGLNFYTNTTTPLVYNMSGSDFLYNPLTGIKMIRGITEPITVTYGVNESGNYVSNINPYGYKFNWINSGGQPKGAVVKY